MREILGGILEGVLGAAKKAASAAVPDRLSDVSGDALDEISSYLVKKLTGGKDTVLFQGSARPDAEGVIRIGGDVGSGARPGSNGRGNTGSYVVELRVTEEEAPE